MSNPTDDPEIRKIIRRVNARIPSGVTPATRIEIHPADWIMLTREIDDLRNKLSLPEELRDPANVRERGGMLNELLNQRNGWEQSAAHFCRGMEYYRGLVDQIGKLIGDAAYIADDGSRSEDILRAKVPELVAARLRAAQS